MAMAVAMVFSFATTAMAATVFDDPTQIENTDVTNTTDETAPAEAEVPVYGYVGRDADITDPDPGDPTKPPVITETGTRISVSVPTKLIWAAFASDGGTVQSPDYTISNNSSILDLDVSLVSFTADTSADNTAVDNKLTLNMASTDFTSISDLLGLSATVKLSQKLAKSGSLGFELDGTYTGSFATSRTPKYEAVFQFDLAA